MPVRRNLRHRFRVAAVVPESDDVVSVHVTGRDLHLLPARAGQFCIWRFPGHFGWWQANPFSLSAAPDGQGLRLTAKAVGTTSAGLRHVPVGSRVLVEGPYGAFTTLQRTGSSLLIAGGIGVTPIRALLEELTAPTIVIYRVRSTADAVLLPELEALARERGADLRVLAGRTGEGDPPIPLFDASSLAAMVPDIVQRDVFVCGPPPMTEAVLTACGSWGCPAARCTTSASASADRGRSASAARTRSAYSSISASSAYLVRGQKKPRSPSPLVRGTTWRWRWATDWLTVLFMATKDPWAPRPSTIAVASRWAWAMKPSRSWSGRSGRVTRWVRGTSRTCPLNTGRMSRNPTKSSSSSTTALGVSPATIEQNRQSMVAEARTHP